MYVPCGQVFEIKDHFGSGACQCGVYPRQLSDLTLLVVHLVPTWKLEPLKSST